MNKLNKVALTILLVLGFVYETSLLISQCRSKTSIDITRQISCTGDNAVQILQSCSENASLVLKQRTPAEFLFITNHTGNPVLTLISVLILIAAFNAAIKIKPYSFITISTLKRITYVLSLIFVKLFIQWACNTYTVNWFKGNPIYYNVGYNVDLEITPLTLFCAVVVFLIWLDYVKTAGQKNAKEIEYPGS